MKDEEISDASSSTRALKGLLQVRQAMAPTRIISTKCVNLVEVVRHKAQKINCAEATSPWNCYVERIDNPELAQLIVDERLQGDCLLLSITMMEEEEYFKLDAFKGWQ